MIYIKTELGMAAIRDRRVVKLPFRQRAALILFEGKRSREAVLAATAPLGVTPTDIDALIAMRLVAPRVLSDPPSNGPPTRPPEPESAFDFMDEAERAMRYRAAYALATELTASLGVRARELHLDVEAAEGIDDLIELLPRLRSVAGPQRMWELQEMLEGR